VGRILASFDKTLKFSYPKCPSENSFRTSQRGKIAILLSIS
jgi:hypothetical protein